MAPTVLYSHEDRGLEDAIRMLENLPILGRCINAFAKPASYIHILKSQSQF